MDPSRRIKRSMFIFKDRNGPSMHLHMQCYDRHDMNAEYMRVLWTGKILSFRTAELYHAIPIGEGDNAVPVVLARP
jgi:hypothetical protein